jgi:hypothetical protein
MMKSVQLCFLFVLTGMAIAGCSSSETAQPSDQVKKQFSGGPMPPDAQKKFQESMKKSHELMQNSQPGGKQ